MAKLVDGPVYLPDGACHQQGEEQHEDDGSRDEGGRLPGRNPLRIAYVVLQFADLALDVLTELLRQPGYVLAQRRETR